MLDLFCGLLLVGWYVCLTLFVLCYCISGSAVTVLDLGLLGHFTFCIELRFWDFGGLL